MTPAEFRATPIGAGFANTTTYPDDTVQFWLDIASNSLDAIRFTDAFIDLATALFVAHNLSLDANSLRYATSGAPGQGVSGVQSGKTVGAASVSYDTSLALDPHAGQWNLTSYGVRLWQLIKMAGMGGMQL